LLQLAGFFLREL